MQARIVFHIGGQNDEDEVGKSDQETECYSNRGLTSLRGDGQRNTDQDKSKDGHRVSEPLTNLGADCDSHLVILLTERVAKLVERQFTRPLAVCRFLDQFFERDRNHAQHRDAVPHLPEIVYIRLIAFLIPGTVDPEQDSLVFFVDFQRSLSRVNYPDRHFLRVHLVDMQIFESRSILPADVNLSAWKLIDNFVATEQGERIL